MVLVVEGSEEASSRRHESVCVALSMGLPGHRMLVGVGSFAIARTRTERQIERVLLCVMPVAQPLAHLYRGL